MSSPAPIPPNESARLAALRAYEILDTAPDADFDDLVRVAAAVCGTPTALISLIDEDRQWFKARVGMASTETPREDAFCAHAILGDGTMVVPDATRDDRFRDNPLVRADPHIRFYAGAPLRSPDGHNLGTLCVIDHEPRGDVALDPTKRDVLEALSRQAVRLMEYRRTSAQLAEALRRVKVLAPLVPVCAWCRKLRTDQNFWTDVEEYLRSAAGVQASHGICPDCAKRQFGMP